MDHRSSNIYPLTNRYGVNNCQGPCRNYPRRQSSYNRTNRRSCRPNVQYSRSRVASRNCPSLGSYGRKGTGNVKASGRVSFVNCLPNVLFIRERSIISMNFRFDSSCRRRMRCRSRCGRISNGATSTSRRYLPCLKGRKSSR